MGARKKAAEGDQMGLEAIEKYSMDEMEALAFRLVLMWIEKSRKAFPDYRHATLGKGDPRKSLMFKICYKLARETKGVLQEQDYPLYIRAQIDVLRHISRNSGNPLIDPNCLVGEKAWKRWRLWKKRYDMIPTSSGMGARGIAHGALKAVDGLEKTKEFLVKSLGGELEEQKYREAVLNNNIFRWINLGKISPYYVAVSPMIAKVVPSGELEKMNFHTDVYLPCINSDVIARFNDLFPGERIEQSEWLDGVAVEDIVE